MIAHVAAFAAGVWHLQYQPGLPAPWQALLLVAVAVIAAATGIGVPVRGNAGQVPSRRAAVTLLTIVMAFGGGFGWAALRAHLALADALGERWEGRDLTVTGVVAGLPQPMDRGARFDFDIESAVPAEAIVPERVSLVWYNGLGPEEFQELQPLRAGERWRLTVRLRRPHGSANPHGFDHEAWMLERGIRATGYVRPPGAGRPGPQRLDALVARPGYLVERARERLRERFWDALPDARHAGVLIALAIGDQRAIDANEWQVFARTGVSHLMSISGLHVTMVSGLFGWLLSGIWRRVPALALRWPAQKAGAAAAAAGALAYCLISGFAVPAQRTLYMVSVVALALLFDRATAPRRVLALALLAVLVLDPWAVMAPGFWLSFGAVAVIFYVGSDRSRRAQHGWLMESLVNWGRVQWAVTVGLVPLLLVLFGQVSIVSPLANALAIPLVSLVITPLALLGAVMPVDGLLWMADWLTAQLVPILEWLSRLEGAVWQQHAPAWWTVPLGLLGVAWLLAPRGFPSRMIGLVLLVPLFGVAPQGPGRGELWLTVFDVGQGLAVLARTSQHALLYDAGPMWSPQVDSGSRVLLPYLRGEGIGTLDALAISHDDNDHAGGAASVAAAMPVSRIISSMTPPDLQAAVGDSRAPFRLPCRAGDAWEWDGVRFRWLHPGPGELADPWGTPNDRSCVLKIEAAYGRALLTGDIERGAESALLAGGSDLASDVLVVPHHGSGTSSTPSFVAAVSPVLAIFPVGYRNRFGHPRADVWERYAGAQRLRTDVAGAVTVRFSAAGLGVEAAREAGRRYWHGR